MFLFVPSLSWERISNRDPFYSTIKGQNVCRDCGGWFMFRRVDIGTGMMQEGHLYRITGDGDHLRKGKAQLDA